VLKGANLHIHSGEMVALVAPSGTGKSTLLHSAGLLERPDSGDVLINGKISKYIGLSLVHIWHVTFQARICISRKHKL